MLRLVLQVPRPARTTTTSAALGPMSLPAPSGMESGLATQASPQLGGGMSGLGMPRASPLPLAGRRSILCWDCHGTSWFYPISFPPPGLDREGAMCSHQAHIWGRPA